MRQGEAVAPHLAGEVAVVTRVRDDRPLETGGAISEVKHPRAVAEVAEVRRVPPADESGRRGRHRPAAPAGTEGNGARAPVAHVGVPAGQ